MNQFLCENRCFSLSVVKLYKKLFLFFVFSTVIFNAYGDVAATHIYHNHMPNFWPYYDVSEYPALPVGAPIRYSYDGQVIELKNNPPENYNFYIPGSNQPMPHDDLVAYYSHHAKKGAYLGWPMDTALGNSVYHPLSQTHVTMSASVINNVQSFAELGNLSGYNLGWGDFWRDTYANSKTRNGFNTLDTIHFSGHHSMGPLVGNDYFLKDLIYQNVTLAQSYFLGDRFVSSKGFFPTELGFSERVIPVLKKLGIEWSVIGNVHFSRTLRDYPYLNDPGIDTLISPPNRADLQNTSNVGKWVAAQMFNEQQVTHNKFPFASIPHWVQYIDPNTAEAYKIAGIPVEQASSWEEGYQGQVTANIVKPFSQDAGDRMQYFVIAHDGDNSSGRAGDGGTWANSGYVTYSDANVIGMGVEEYLLAHPIPANDIVHVQDGSWIDTRDSSADPTWYHWHLPFGVWKGQMHDFNRVNNTDFTATRQHMVSLELGYHYLERNFALLQAAENYAKTAEQIWLDDNPDYWQPSTAMDNQVTYSGNQLNPWMMSYPVKGDENNNYAGGANPAELAWYFLIAAIDSGFGYYDENVDDGVKPTISFNQSLYFSSPYVEKNKTKDTTGPSVWWPQRYPYNPGSVNVSKAEGWAKLYANTKLAIYTYAFDVNKIDSIELKIRTHRYKTAEASDKSFKLYNPSLHAGDPNVDPSRVGDWKSFPMLERDLSADINGVEWQAASSETFAVVPAEKIGNLYYAYLEEYQDQLLDYYIEARDSLGNITRSDIQQVYVGAGRYKQENGKTVEDVNGDILGENPFFTDNYIPGNRPPVAKLSPGDLRVEAGTQLTLSAADSFDPDGEIVSYLWSNGSISEQIEVTVNSKTTYTVTVTDSLGAKDSTSATYRVIGQIPSATLYYRNTQEWQSICLHYSIDGVKTWTPVPGVPMEHYKENWYRLSVDLDFDLSMEFVVNNCSGVWDNNGGSNYQLGDGIWNLDSGVIAEGVPSINIPPTARINPENPQINNGESLVLSASGSTDSDGYVESFLWSTGETTPEITLAPKSTQTISLIVTDNQGAKSEVSTLVSVIDDRPKHEFDHLYYRGTSNAWVTSAMELVEDNLWQIDIVFDGQVEQRFKFDVSGNWEQNYGDSNGDGILDQNGGDIYFSKAGKYRVEVNDKTLEYKIYSLELPYAANFPQVYFRGTPNNWEASAMQLIADHTWSIEIDFDGREDQRFKFDIYGDWSENYGLDDGEIIVRSGEDIPIAIEGQYFLLFNDNKMTYEYQ